MYRDNICCGFTNVDEGNASFVVLSYGDINAPVAGDVLLVGFRGNDPDGSGSAYTYQWYRDGADIAGATGFRIDGENTGERAHGDINNDYDDTL